MPLPLKRLVPMAMAGAMLGGCGADSDQAARVVVIGAPLSPFSSGPGQGPAPRLLRAATAEGLVDLDAEGKVIPGLADRWIVTDDGLSFIFRMRDGTWANGTPLTGETARAALAHALAGLAGSALALDLAPVQEVRATAGRVIELRLSRPMPDLLQLLAQPELGLTHHGLGTGPMALTRDGTAAKLTVIAPERRGMPAVEDWAGTVRPLRLSAMPGESAIAAFRDDRVQVVLGGTFADLPRVLRAGLPRGVLRIDPVAGLFGLLVMNENGLLGIAQNREAIAMAIDRPGLAAAFGLPAWATTTRIVSPGLEGDLGLVSERWQDYDLGGRRALAAPRVAAWVQFAGKPAHLRIALPTGPGTTLLAARLVNDLATIGLGVEIVGPDTPADLKLLDRVAQYPSNVWFFNQLNCRAIHAPCSAAADALVAQGAQATPAQAAGLYAQAERELTDANDFIPLGVPIRWSLAATNVSGFSTNRWGFHPLLPMATRPH